MSATLYQLCHTLTFFTKVVEPICSIDCTIGEGSHVAQLAEPAALAGLNVELIKQIFLLLAEFGGRIHNNSHDVGATSAAAQVRNTVSAQFKIGSALRAGRNFHAHRAVDGFDINLGAQCRLDHTDMLGTQNEVAFARKLFVCPNADAHVQVAFSTASDRFAVFAQADGSAVVDAGRDFQGDGFALAGRALTMAHRTCFFWNFALAVTSRTGCRLLDIAENGAHHVHDLAGAAAVVAGFEFEARFGRCAMTVLADIIKVELHCFFSAEHRFFKADFYARFNVAATRLLPAGAIATKKTFKNVAESQIAKVEVHILAASPAKTGKRIAITRRAAAHAGMPKLVVTLAFGRIF